MGECMGTKGWEGADGGGTGTGGNLGGKGDGRWETGIFVVWGGGSGWMVGEKRQDQVAIATY